VCKNGRTEVLDFWGMGILGSTAVCEREPRSRTRTGPGLGGSFSYFGPVEAKKRITVLAALHSEDCDLRGWLKPGRFSRLRRVVAGLQRWTAAGE
jgi:hypothetical protein